MAKFVDIYNHLQKTIPIEESYSQETYGASNCEELEEVKKILYCVTPSGEIDKYFEENGYDLLICHHLGYSDSPHLTFHTALDFCEGGLTDYWSKLLKIQEPKPINKNAGAYGKIEPIAFEELVNLIDEEVDGIVGQCVANKEIIETIAVCSGFGAVIQSSVEKLDVDCYILGQTFSKCEDTKLNGIIEIGHTKSERIGAKCIREMLKDFKDVTVDVAPLDIDRYGAEVGVKRFEEEVS